MTSLTPEQRAYKQKALEQLLVNLPLLQAQLPQETRREIVNSLKNQLEEMRGHIDLLQRELAANTTIEPVAAELFQRAAAALTKNKFYLAKRLINKLETIEPFYPGIDRLRQEAEAGRASRRTQAMAQGGPGRRETHPVEPGLAATASLLDEHDLEVEEPPKKGLAQFFQFHIIISCLLVLLILCVFAGVGGMMLLQWLFQGQ